MERVLTGIKPTGMPHLGNYFGAIKPAIEMSKRAKDVKAFYFIADAHALTSVRDPQKFKDDVYHVAATWLALGLDPDKVVFFKQSDVAETFELSWILSCLTPKGDLNRAHSYKDKIAKNSAENRDQDYGVNLGLFSYPVLMAADILLYDTTQVPVGKDQVQHIEIARSIAQRINEVFSAGTLVEPKEVLQDSGSYIPGVDGRKMSKSYDNTIGVLIPEGKLKKLINKLKTDSSGPDEPKDPSHCLIMDLYKLFATKEEVFELERRYREGIGWGHAKAELFTVANRELQAAREKFDYYMTNKSVIDHILAEGAKKARLEASRVLRRVKRNITGF